MRRRRSVAAGLAILAGLALPSPGQAGLAEDIAYCQTDVWPRFAGWSLSRQRGADEPRTPVDFYCLALGHWSGQAQFQPKDLAKAARFAQTAAEQNHPAAQGLLGFFYSKGNGVKQDQAAAIVWWKKAAAQGHADSLNALASAYDNGQGVPVDKNEALRLYRLAAERGSKEARQTLATRDKPQVAQPGQQEFDEGVRLYKAGQQAAAAKLFLRAAEMGNARAQLQIGYQYNYGEGVPVNGAEAVKWYRRAADQGDATAQANLGAMYEDGNGVPEDWVEAAKWYRKSAEKDNANGQFRLGRAYQFGIGVSQNRKLAVEWFQKASFLGHAQARYFAQHLLSRGNFVGFRNEQEESYVIAGKLRTGLLWEEPVGALFRNSGERLAYIKNLRYRVDRYEAYQAWVSRRNEYDECKRAGTKSYCADPGPAPQ
jgi:TPR repeat protein